MIYLIDTHILLWFMIKDFLDLVSSSGFSILPIQIKHITELSNLPFHHKDPFDRLIIAQAKTENFAVISSDSYFKEYDIQLA